VLEFAVVVLDRQRIFGHRTSSAAGVVAGRFDIQ
jgi:hypothetical protein